MALTFSTLHPKPSRTNFKNFSSCLGLPKPSPHPHPTFASLFVSAGGRVPSRCGRAWWGRRPISMWPQPWACASMAWFHDMVTRAPAWQLEVPGRNQRWVKWTLETMVSHPNIENRSRIFGEPILVGFKGWWCSMPKGQRRASQDECGLFTSFCKIQITIFSPKCMESSGLQSPSPSYVPPHECPTGAKGPKGCTPSLNLNLVCCAPKGMKPPFSTMAGNDRSCLFDSWGSGIICLSHSAGGVAWFGDAWDLRDRQLNWIHLAIGFLGPTSWIRILLHYAHIQQTYTHWDVYTCMIVYVYQTKSVRYVHVHIQNLHISSYTHNCPELSTFMLPSSTPIQPLLAPLAFGVGPGRTT